MALKTEGIFVDYPGLSAMSRTIMSFLWDVSEDVVVDFAFCVDGCCADSCGAMEVTMNVSGSARLVDVEWEWSDSPGYLEWTQST